MAIYREQLKEILNQISAKDLQDCIYSKFDYVSLECNGYGYIILDSKDFTEEEENEIKDSGDLFCDKDDLLMLFSEVGIDYESLLNK